MKVLFLDIDGVLNSERTRVAFKGFPMTLEDADTRKLDHVAIALVRKLCEVTGAQVVMSSAWRTFFPVERFAEAFELPVIDATPDLSVQQSYSPIIIAQTRGAEIKAWLGDHPEVTDYAIVDDMDDMLEEQAEYFVRTDDRNGLSYNDFLMLQNILGRLPDTKVAA